MVLEVLGYRVHSFELGVRVTWYMVSGVRLHGFGGTGVQGT